MRLVRKLILGMLVVPGILAASAVPAAATEKKDYRIGWAGTKLVFDNAGDSHIESINVWVSRCLNGYTGRFFTLEFYPGTCEMAYYPTDLSVSSSERYASPTATNSGMEPWATSLTWSDTVGVSDTSKIRTWGDDAQMNARWLKETVLQTMDDAIKSQYSLEQFRQDVTMTGEVSFTLPPCHMAWVTHSAELKTVTGDLVLAFPRPNFKGTLVTIKNVSLTAPSGTGVARVVSRGMTPQEREGHACAAMY